MRDHEAAERARGNTSFLLRSFFLCSVVRRSDGFYKGFLPV